jgi:hypothetical protein
MNNYLKKIVVKNNYIYKTDSNISNDYIKYVEDKLKILKLENVPKIKFFDNKTFYYEYINGIDLYNYKYNYDYFQIKNEFINIIKSIEILIKNNITTLEIKPKNIIINNNKLYLIDIIDVINNDFKYSIINIKKEIIRTFIKIKLNMLQSKNSKIDEIIKNDINNNIINTKLRDFYLDKININFTDIITRL